MSEDLDVDKFAAVYAEAVLTFLDSGEPQALTWDGASSDFDFCAVGMEDRMRAPVMLVVDEQWERAVGELPVSTDVEAPDFDADALREAVEAQIADEGYGERLLKRFQEKLEGYDDEDDEEGYEEE